MAVFSGSFLSADLGRHTSVSVILPHDTQQSPPAGFPVLYLLHGQTDDNRSWLYRSNIERYANERGIAVVMPDAELSYYIDMAYGGQYFSYITRELPEVMQAMFRLSMRREDTYIAGVSMGGYGAIRCALLRPEKYAGCIALSPEADIARIIAKQSFDGKKAMWTGICGGDLRTSSLRDIDLFHILEDIGEMSAAYPKFYLACGKNDPLYDDVLRLKEAMDNHYVEFTFEQAAAGHEWGFWDIAIQRGMEAIIKR